MGVEKYFVGAILVLTTLLTVIVAVGFYASMTADRVVGMGYPVSSEGGVGSPSPSSGVNEFKMFDVDYPDYGINGHTFCSNRGYNRCVMESRWFVWVYYDSVDTSCTGLQQINDGHIESESCDTVLAEGSNPCTRLPYGYLTEPVFGDTKTSWQPEKVLCAR